MKNEDKIINSLLNAKNIILDIEDTISDLKEMAEKCPDLEDANIEADKHIREILNQYTEKRARKSKKNVKIIQK